MPVPRPIHIVKAPTLEESLAQLLVGQPEAIRTILPYVQMHEAGLSPDNRPVGVVLLLGPTGTGKTKTVESLAEVLHGNPKHMLRVDCGELQLEHDMAKLLGAPPGYLGHRETVPLLTQARLTSVTSPNSNLSLVLFDEIEKAAISISQLLLGILDTASLRLADNSLVSFENSLIFMTSNLGARQMQDAAHSSFGFGSLSNRIAIGTDTVHAIGMTAVRKKFSPEFVNRVDSVIAYRSLQRVDYEAILEHICSDFSSLVQRRMGTQSFELATTLRGRDQLLDLGSSVEFGARELKRVVQRHFMQPIAAMKAQGQIPAQSRVTLDAKNGEFKILVRQ